MRVRHWRVREYCRNEGTTIFATDFVSERLQYIGPLILCRSKYREPSSVTSSSIMIISNKIKKKKQICDHIIKKFRSISKVGSIRTI